MSICFCIPARLNSTRLNEKLLLKINGESCIRKTIKQVLKSTYYNNDNIFIFTDNEVIKNEIYDLPCQTFLTSSEYKNGCERISKNLHFIEDRYNIIVNVQADEPFISEKNIDFAIKQHLENEESQFYTTLHEEKNSDEYLMSTGSLKMTTDLNNNVMYYSRNIIPWNKKNKLLKNYIYKTFTGIYVFNREMLNKYSSLPDTPLQIMEDCEQLKILENGYKIKSYPTIEYNEISLNTEEDYKYFQTVYDINY